MQMQSKHILVHVCIQISAKKYIRIHLRASAEQALTHAVARIS